MKITPTAIRQKSFETGFRGFEKKDVSAFLEEISEVVDTLHKENMELKTKLQHTESEAKRLKDVEDSLFRTLKTAEDTGASIIEEANEAADLIIAEANESAQNATAQAEKILASAKQIAERDAATIITAAETRAKQTIIELRESMQGLVRSYESLAEQRESMVKSLKRIAQDALNQIDLSDAHFSRIDAKAHQRAIEELSRSQAFTFANLLNLTADEEDHTVDHPEDQDNYQVEDELSETAEEETPKEELQEVEMTDLGEKQNEFIEDPVQEEVEQEIQAETDLAVEEVKATEPENETIRKKDQEEQKNESGSFFDNLG